jgi:hypothetical protein
MKSVVASSASCRNPGSVSEASPVLEILVNTESVVDAVLTLAVAATNQSCPDTEGVNATIGLSVSDVQDPPVGSVIFSATSLKNQSVSSVRSSDKFM